MSGDVFPLLSITCYVSPLLETYVLVSRMREVLAGSKALLLSFFLMECPPASQKTANYLLSRAAAPKVRKQG